MEIDILDRFHEASLDDFPNRLLGKFFTNSTPPSLEETESSLRQQWPEILPENMTLQTQENDRFLFNFKQKEDKEHVLANGPLVVNGVMLIIKEFTSNDIDFTVTDLSVTVTGLPLYLGYKTEVLTNIQTLLSNNPNIEPLFNRSKSDLYFRTEIDLKKPLNPGFYFDENLFVEFKYNNIGDFCYNCGMMSHIKSDCDQESPKERTLNAKSKTKTPVYGPWLRSKAFSKAWMTLKLNDKLEKEEDVKECEKILPYPQFFIQLKSDIKAICNDSDPSVLMTDPSSHSFRFPSSYLESTDLATSKAFEVIASEINEIIAPYSLEEFEDKSINWPIKEKSNVICSLVEHLNEIRKKNSEDKWLPLELEINIIYKLTPVDYQTMLNEDKDLICFREIEKKMSDLVKKKVEQGDNLVCLNLWESEIRKGLEEIGYSDYPYLFDVSERALRAKVQAIQMAISFGSRPIPAERQSVEKLERKKMMGSEIDRLDPCVICSQEMFLAEEVTVLPCSHVFHSLCSHEWFEIGHKCPLCGYELPLQK